MEIRKISVADAGAYLALQQKLDEETSFMLFEPGERDISVEKVREHLQEIEEADHLETFVAEEDGFLAGHLQVRAGALRRNSYTAYVVIGLLKDYHRKGIGTRLFQELDAWAKEHSIRRLELTVMEHNRAAMILYAKAGFQVEGMRKQSLYVDDEFVNEFYMAKIMEWDAEKIQ